MTDLVERIRAAREVHAQKKAVHDAKQAKLDVARGAPLFLERLSDNWLIDKAAVLGEFERAIVFENIDEDLHMSSLNCMRIWASSELKQRVAELEEEGLVVEGKETGSIAERNFQVTITLPQS